MNIILGILAGIAFVPVALGVLIISLVIVGGILLGLAYLILLAYHKLFKV